MAKDFGQINDTRVFPANISTNTEKKEKEKREKKN